MTDPLFDDLSGIVRPYVSKPEREGRVIRGVAPVRTSVEFRFIGTQAQIGRLLGELEHLYTLTDVSQPLPSKDHDGRVRVYGLISRSARLGGAR